MTDVVIKAKPADVFVASQMHVRDQFPPDRQDVNVKAVSAGFGKVKPMHQAKTQEK